MGASINVDSKNDRVKIVGDSVDLSDKTKASFEKTGKGSTIGLGAIPPSAKKDLLDGVSVCKVISTRVVSFATVRTFHFGKGAEGDAAIRALIIAVLLRDIAGYDANPFIRANCFLSETGKPTVVLNKRYGEKEELEPLTVDLTEKLRRTVQYIYLTALALLGLCMLIFPRQLWKISNFLWTQKGDPSNLYTSLMRISGAAFLVLALILFIFCRLQ